MCPGSSLIILSDDKTNKQAYCSNKSNSIWFPIVVLIK